LRFEGWIDRLVRVAGTRHPVVVASHGVTPRTREGAPDPHAWQRLANARLYVENIRAALAQAAPQKAQAIDARAAAYLRRIDGLQQRGLARFAAVPEAQRRVITTHDAFGYFGQAFGVRFIAPLRWTTDAEPSAADVASVIRQIKAQRASALFVENMSDRRLIDRISRETGARVGGTLYADALSPPGTAGDTYLRFMAHNIDSVVSALGEATPVAVAMTVMAAASANASASAPSAAAGHAHEHGVVKLDITIEPGKLTVQMESPLDNLVGFERAPRSDAERKTVAAAVARLQAADTLFKIDPAGGCTLKHVDLTSAPLTLGRPEPGAGADGHADLDGGFEFTCKNSALVAFIDLGLFSAFGHMQRIDVQIAALKGQAKRTLKRPDVRITLGR
jgi:zinc/manganese transport system substrate-binding protein